MELEKILNDLVYVDNIASKVNEKKELEFNSLKDSYDDEEKKMTVVLEEEKAKEEEYMEKAFLDVEKDAGAIAENKDATIKALEKKYKEIKAEIIKKAIFELFDMESD